MPLDILATKGLQSNSRNVEVEAFLEQDGESGESPHYCRLYARSFAFDPAAGEISVLEMASLNLPKGLIYPEQKSYFCTLAWCEKGSFTVDGRGWTHEVLPGQVAVVDNGIHFSVSAGAAGIVGHYLLVDGPMCHNLLKDSGLWQGVFDSPVIPKEWLAWIATGLIQPSRQAVVAHTSHQLFKQVGQQARQLYANPTLWDACQYLQMHWGMAQLNVDSLAAHLDVSRSKLYELFKSHLGVSINKYLSDVRLFHAKRLLTDSNLHISEIAAACGFPAASYFSSWFRKHAGISPSALRADATRHSGN